MQAIESLEDDLQPEVLRLGSITLEEVDEVSAPDLPEDSFSTKKRISGRRSK